MNILSTIWNFLKGLKWSQIQSVLIVILIFVLILSFRTCSNNKGELKSYENIVKLKEQTIKTWQDKDSLNHSVIQQSEASAAVIKLVYEKQLDSIATVLGIKEKKIKEYINIISTAHGNGGGTLQPVNPNGSVVVIPNTTPGNTGKVDTVAFKMLVFDKFLEFQADITKRNTYTYNYTYTEELKYAVYQHGKANYIDVWSSNPNSKITGLKEFKISDIEKPKRFSIGPYVGAGWDGTKITPSVGIGLQYSLIRF